MREGLLGLGSGKTGPETPWYIKVGRLFCLEAIGENQKFELTGIEYEKWPPGRLADGFTLFWFGGFYTEASKDNLKWKDVEGALSSTGAKENCWVLKEPTRHWSKNRQEAAKVHWVRKAHESSFFLVSEKCQWSPLASLGNRNASAFVEKHPGH